MLLYESNQKLYEIVNLLQCIIMIVIVVVFVRMSLCVTHTQFSICFSCIYAKTFSVQFDSIIKHCSDLITEKHKFALPKFPRVPDLNQTKKDPPKLARKEFSIKIFREKYYEIKNVVNDTNQFSHGLTGLKSLIVMKSTNFNFLPDICNL